MIETFPPTTITVAPDTINNHVKTCREEQKSLHFFAPEYGGKVLSFTLHTFVFFWSVFFDIDHLNSAFSCCQCYHSRGYLFLWNVRLRGERSFFFPLPELLDAYWPALSCSSVLDWSCTNPQILSSCCVLQKHPRGQATQRRVSQTGGQAQGCYGNPGSFQNKASWCRLRLFKKHSKKTLFNYVAYSLMASSEIPSGLWNGFRKRSCAWWNGSSFT